MKIRILRVYDSVFMGYFAFPGRLYFYFYDVMVLLFMFGCL